MSQSSVKRRYGHVRGKQPSSYPKISFGASLRSALPPRINLIESISLPRSQEPYDQGELGSCTANGLAFAYVYDELKQKNKIEFMPSRLFIYYNERELEGSIDNDSGAQISDGISVLKTKGVCEEKLWPYDCPKFTVKPDDSCFSEAAKFKVVNSLYIDLSADKSPSAKLLHLKSALAKGFPIVFGFRVFESFEKHGHGSISETGIMPMPSIHEEELGGHCVDIVGYDDAKEAFLIRNSWGTKWGTHAVSHGSRGYFWMPYNFVSGGDINGSYCSDFWIITNVTNPLDQDQISSVSLNPTVVNLDPGTDSQGVVHQT